MLDGIRIDGYLGSVKKQFPRAKKNYRILGKANLNGMLGGREDKLKKSDNSNFSAELYTKF